MCQRFDKVTISSIASFPILLYLIWRQGNFPALLSLVSCNCYFWSHMYHCGLEQSRPIHHLDMLGSIICYLVHILCASARYSLWYVLSHPLVIMLQFLSVYSFYMASGRHNQKYRTKRYIYHHSNFHIFASLLGITFIIL
jgi:hypothetical protein